MQCIFCGREGPASREHLWPRWAQDTYGEDERGKRVRHSIEPHDRPHRSWEAPVFSATLKEVCRECNQGWMSRIEAEAKAHMEPLIRGEEGRVVDTEAQWAISRWAYLKVLLFERVDSRQRLLAEGRCREMYESSLEEPSLRGDMSVFLAAHEGRREGQYAHRLLGDARSGRPELFIGTITIRCLVVQVIADIAEDGELRTFQRDRRIAGRDARIWPFCAPFEWPPGPALTDAGLEIFAGPKPGEVSTERPRLLRRLFRARR